MTKENTHTRLNINEHLVFKANLSQLVRNEKFDEKDVLAVPVILMVEGVHNEVLYTEEELQKFVSAWNGRPVPIYHPQDPKTGEYICANQPHVLEKRCIGQLFNSKFENGKLKAEAWIDPIKANKIDPSVMLKLNNNQMLEVSTGLWFDAEEREGEWNGEKYVAIAYNFRPDHLAFLPEQVGACSIQDGAGAPRVNYNKEDINVAKSIKEKTRDLYQSLKDKIFGTNELSHKDIRKQLGMKIVEKISLPDDQYIWVRDVYDNSVIYEVESTDEIKLYKLAYTKDANEEIILAGEPVEVKEKVDYIPVTANSKEDETDIETNKKIETNKVKINTKKGEKVMEDRTKRVDALINNEKVDFAEADRDFLAGLEDAQFEKIEKMIPNEKIEKEDPKKGKESEATQEPAKPVNNEQEQQKPVTLSEAIANFPKEMQEMIVNGVSMVQSKKQNLINNVLTANKDLFTKEELEAKELPELEKLAKMSKVETDFSGVAGNASAVNSSGEKPMEVPRLMDKIQSSK